MLFYCTVVCIQICHYLVKDVVRDRVVKHPDAGARAYLVLTV